MICGALVVQFFHTCLVNEVDPAVGLAAVRLLERLGCDVRVPLAQTCCGQPAHNGGFHDAATEAARHTIAVLDATEGAIVVPSGSCADMLVHQYPLLFAREPATLARAGAVAARTREFSQFVAERLPDDASCGTLSARVAYHPSCHLLRGLGIHSEPAALLSRVNGVTVATVQDSDECCGFGGLFSLKHPDISAAMLDRKIANVVASGAERLVSCDLGCLLHLGGGLHRRGSPIKVQHLAELLDEAQPR
jgi:L-lactate dehydrogenase complex protein LldE